MAEKAQLETIKEFFAGKEIFNVPEYQRDYAWGKKQICELLDDIEFVDKNNIEKYYFGPAVIHGDVDEAFIIDGQQRLTSLLLIFKIFKNFIEELNPDSNNELNKNLHRMMFYNNNLRLKLGITDEDNFKNFIDEKDSKEILKTINKSLREEPLTNRKLHEAFKRIYKYFLDKLIEIEKSYSNQYDKIKNEKNELSKDYKKDKEQTIRDWGHERKTLTDELNKLKRKYDEKKKNFEKSEDKIKKNVNSEKIKLIQRNYNIITDRFIILRFKEDYNNANLLFETLNNRGRPLSSSDLIKNHIIKTSLTNKDDINETWKKIKNDVSSKMDSFLSDYCTMKFGNTPKKEVYAKFKVKYSSEVDIKKLVKELSKCSHIYKNIIQPNNEKDIWNNKKITDMLQDMINLNGVVFRPLILYAKLSNMKTAEIEELIELCLKIFVNHKIIGKERFEGLKEISDLCLGHKNNKDKIEKLNKIEKLKINEIKKYFKIKYNKKYFERLDSLNTTQNDIFKVLLKKAYFKDLQFNFEDIELEHIIPQSVFENWNKNKTGNVSEWYEILKDDKKFKPELIYNLGNTALVTKDENLLLKDNSFNKKIKIFKNSSWSLTNSIKGKKWTSIEIENRQTELKNAISKAWSMDEIFRD